MVVVVGGGSGALSTRRSEVAVAVVFVRGGAGRAEEE